MTMIRLTVSAMYCLGLATPLSAHYGVTGEYDGAVPIVLAGTVGAATFPPPHPVITMQVDVADLPKGPPGRPENYHGAPVVRPEDPGQRHAVELAPARMFYALADQLEVGDSLTVVALRNCAPPHQLRSSWLQLSDGPVLSYDGDWAPLVDGCRIAMLEAIENLEVGDGLRGATRSGGAGPAVRGRSGAQNAVSQRIEPSSVDVADPCNGANDAGKRTSVAGTGRRLLDRGVGA